MQIQAVSPFARFEEQLASRATGESALRRLLSGPTSRRVHRYDALGRCIETISSTFGSLGRDRETLEYNQYGDPIAQTSEHESLEYGFAKTGETRREETAR